MSWPPSCVKATEPLANHTSFRIGGSAEWYAEAHTLEQLLELVHAADAAGLPVAIIGGGTNLLVPDRGLRGLVLRLAGSFRSVEVEADDGDSVLVRCGSAVMTQRLVSLAAREGWGGLEKLAGLPGQVGGAVKGNAQNIGAFVERVTLVGPDGGVAVRTRDRLHFAYRDAYVGAGIVTEVLLRFPRAAASEPIQQALCYRNTTQDLQLPSAGCAFKNPVGNAAGRLIDQAGLKGHRIGDAQVSLRHANFIVNLGWATCDDVLALMEYVQRRVRSVHGVHLEPEIRILGERR
jgi:UDP-N-acetylmuramate dehydrogenase